MLEDSLEQVVGVTGVERAVAAAGHDVDVEHGALSSTSVLLLFSSRLAFGKRIFAGSRPSSGSVWAPAFAGENGDKLGLSVILQLAVKRPRFGGRAAAFADGFHLHRRLPPADGEHQRIARPHAARRLVQPHRFLAGTGQADLAGFHHVGGEGARLEETRAPQPYVDAAGQVVAAHRASAAGLALERRRLRRRGLAWCAGSAERCNEPSARCITPSPPCCAPASAVGRGVRREDREIVLDPMPAEAGRSSPPSPVNGRGVSGLAVRFSPLPSTGEEDRAKRGGEGAPSPQSPATALRRRRFGLRAGSTSGAANLIAASPANGVERCGRASSTTTGLAFLIRQPTGSPGLARFTGEKPSSRSTALAWISVKPSASRAASVSTMPPATGSASRIRASMRSSVSTGTARPATARKPRAASARAGTAVVRGVIASCAAANPGASTSANADASTRARSLSRPGAHRLNAPNRTPRLFSSRRSAWLSVFSSGPSARRSITPPASTSWCATPRARPLSAPDAMAFSSRRNGPSRRPASAAR